MPTVAISTPVFRSADRQAGEFEPGLLFGGRYRIERLLGRGGMGAVYQAWDAAVDVHVALKVIRPHGHTDDATLAELERRFKRELLLGRQVTHRHVVRIFDLGEVDGIKYITMPYVEGEDLATRLRREGTLPVSRALVIARGVAAGLAAAHEAGVVHRDLKPANVMVTDTDEPLVMDFGIARLATAHEGDGSNGTPGRSHALTAHGALTAGQTVAGTLVGTYKYMAPEQKRSATVDQRADVYAFGLILQEMLVGRKSRRRTASAAGTEAPASEMAIPRAVQQILDRCLQEEPDDRYQTAGEIVRALDRLDDEGNERPEPRRVTPVRAAAAVLGGIALVGAGWWFARTPAPPPAPAPMSVLVADFVNQTGDPIFSGTVEQTLGVAIEGASFITAYPRGQARQLAAKMTSRERLDEPAARLLARREGIRVVLAGAVAREGAGYRIGARAIDPTLDPSTSKPLADASRFAASRDDVLRAVATLGTTIRQGLGDASPRGAAAADAETFTAGSLEAMRAYVRGQELSAAGRFDEALSAYEEAVKLDPNFGRAYAGLGVTYGNMRQEAKAEASYQKALKLLDRMTEREKYRTLGGYYLTVARNYDRAIENYETLVRRYPADRAGHANLALAYVYVRNFERATSEGRKAVELSPSNVPQRMNYANFALYNGDFVTAVTEAQRVLTLSPGFGYAWFTLGRANLGAGAVRKARESYGRLRETSGPGRSLAPLGLADLALSLGRPREAIGLLRPAVAADERAVAPSDAAIKLVMLAEAYQAVGAKRDAIAAATRAATLSRQEAVLFPAARVLATVGDETGARRIATDLANMLQAQTTAYARLIDAELALARGKRADALDRAREARKQHDSWFAHQLLGRIYLEAGHHAEALAELELCVKRRGEAADVFLADGATYHYLPPVFYWLARAQEGIGAHTTARVNDDQYLALRTEPDTPDPFVADIEKRRQPLVHAQ